MMAPHKGDETQRCQLMVHFFFHSSMKWYTIDFRSHLRHLWLMICLLILLPFAMYFLMIIKYGVFDMQKAIIAGVLVFVLFIFPMILLHLNYYLVNRNHRFAFDESQGEMIFRNGQE